MNLIIYYDAKILLLFNLVYTYSIVKVMLMLELVYTKLN